MIKSFKHKGLEKYYKTGSLQGIQAIHAKRLRLILNRLNLMENIQDMNFPSAKLHQLKGDMKNLWSVTVQANWGTVSNRARYYPAPNPILTHLRSSLNNLIKLSFYGLFLTLNGE